LRKNGPQRLKELTRIEYSFLSFISKVEGKGFKQTLTGYAGIITPNTDVIIFQPGGV
jgi:hypothetical protein